jgi:hypothetical protein
MTRTKLAFLVAAASAFAPAAQGANAVFLTAYATRIGACAFNIRGSVEPSHRLDKL